MGLCITKVYKQISAKPSLVLFFFAISNLLLNSGIMKMCFEQSICIGSFGFVQIPLNIGLIRISEIMPLGAKIQNIVISIIFVCSQLETLESFYKLYLCSYNWLFFNYRFPLANDFSNYSLQLKNFQMEIIYHLILK